VKTVSGWSELGKTETERIIRKKGRGPVAGGRSATIEDLNHIDLPDHRQGGRIMTVEAVVAVASVGMVGIFHIEVKTKCCLRPAGNIPRTSEVEAAAEAAVGVSDRKGGR
jgi:hypothetical protein